MTAKKRRSTEPTLKLTLRIREFGIPPVHDGLVLGRNAPIGCVAMQKAVALLHAAPFERIEIDDEVIRDLLIRSNILLRVPRDRLVALVIERIKPRMAAEEIMHLQLEAELVLEDQT
jgi:hypothetical protein